MIKRITTVYVNTIVSLPRYSAKATQRAKEGDYKPEP